MTLPNSVVNISFATDPLDTPDWSLYAFQVNADSPAAYWRLGESAGTVAADETGVHPGTYVNTPTLGVAGALAGDTDTAVTFTAASSHYLEAADAATLRGFSAITIEFWYKTTVAAIGFDRPFICKASRFGVLAGDYCVYIPSGNLLGALSIKTVAGQVAVTTSATYWVTTGAWTHAAITYDGANVRFYTNGVLIETVPSVNTLQMDTTNDLRFMRFSDVSTNYLDGSLDEVAIYSTVLSPARIVIHYDAALSVASGGGIPAYSLDITRGRLDENGQMQAGTATVEIENDNRDYEPFYPASIYYGTTYPGNIVPSKRVRIRVDDITTFVGFVEEWLNHIEGGVNLCRLTAVDYTRFLEKAQIDFRSIFDTFDRADTTSGLGDLDKQPLGVNPWTTETAATSAFTTAISGNRAKLSLTFAGANSYGVALVVTDVDVGAIQVDISPQPSGSSYTGIAFRYDTATDNHYFAGVLSNGGSSIVALYRFNAGVYTLVQNRAIAAPEPGATLRVHTDAFDRATVSINDVVLLDATVNASPAGDSHGFGVMSTAAVTEIAYFDNFAAWNEFHINSRTGQDMAEKVLNNVNWPSGDRILAQGSYNVKQYLGEYYELASALLNEALDAAETAIDVTDGGAFAAGETIKIDDEWMQITSISGNVLNVTRAVGSTAATHTSGTAVYISRWAATPQLGSALAFLQALAQAEGGAFYIDREGNAVFEGATTRSTQARSITAQVTLGLGAIAIEGGLDYYTREADIVNRVMVSRDGGVEYLLEDTASQTDYMLGDPQSFTGLILRDDADARSVGLTYLNRHRLPTPRFSNVSVNVNTLTDTTDMLEREISDAIAITVHQPHGGTDISGTQIIERIQHTYERGNRFTTTLSLTPGQLSQFWLLGVAGRSELGITTILA